MKKNNILFKILFILVVMVIALGLIYIALKEVVPDLIPIIRAGDVDEIQVYLKENGRTKGILCTILLQMVQVWSLFIAGMPIQVAAGCAFGVGIAFVVCHLASVAGQFIALLAWREAGQRLEKYIPVDMNNSRINAFLTAQAPPGYLVIMACMIPVMPNGLIPLLVSKMDISYREFTFDVWVGNIANVLLCCAVGNRIIKGDWLIACIFFAVLIGLFLTMWFCRERVLVAYNKLKGLWRQKHPAKTQPGKTTSN